MHFLLLDFIQSNCSWSLNYIGKQEIQSEPMWHIPVQETKVRYICKSHVPSPSLNTGSRSGRNRTFLPKGTRT